MNQTSNNIPESLAKIVDQVIDELSLEDRAIIAKLEEGDIEIINTLMTDYIQNKLSEWSIQYKEAALTEPEAIVKEIWKRLRETHKLRVVKGES